MNGRACSSHAAWPIRFHCTFSTTNIKIKKHTPKSSPLVRVLGVDGLEVYVEESNELPVPIHGITLDILVSVHNFPDVI